MQFTHLLISEHKKAKFIFNNIQFWHEYYPRAAGKNIKLPPLTVKKHPKRAHNILSKSVQKSGFIIITVNVCYKQSTPLGHYNAILRLPFKNTRLDFRKQTGYRPYSVRQ